MTWFLRGASNPLHCSNVQFLQPYLDTAFGWDKAPDVSTVAHGICHLREFLDKTHARVHEGTGSIRMNTILHAVCMDVCMIPYVGGICVPTIDFYRTTCVCAGAHAEAVQLVTVQYELAVAIVVAAIRAQVSGCVH